MFAKLVLALSFVVVVIGLARYKRLTMPFKLLSISLLIGFLIDAGNSYYIAIYKNNYGLSHAQTIIEYIFYALIYYYLFKSKYIKKLVLFSIMLVITFFIINSLFLQPYNKIFPTYVILTTEVLYGIFAVLLYKQMLFYPLQIDITRQSIFWFDTAILFFSTTMFVNLAIMNYYSQHNHHSPIAMFFWYSIDIVFSVLLGITILIDKKGTTTANA
jgi:hypothetical protein